MLAMDFLSLLIRCSSNEITKNLKVVLIHSILLFGYCLDWQMKTDPIMNVI
jgi:hypothetical protein